mmetsp:Transcript_19402/g.42467  ORF Transcript_19402/g.42467 Transcript_19402/m.42467 type:complete len:419 (-) Transcript_19402:221-1477(-)|eukprot:CAMPEP_0118934644 /NCGR_PEP_ID=MMETSP1169-20130426/13938_1 /TAXON_ID=36882 /ORGANISM="Pyramimonas obovata, Strain CCMP722" /LENGTH=418 /DNA_ID=CAMNT_0006877569 /DNA_START=164 /DNA_END=1420 /DNA_ORIENTATION=+
MENLEDSSAPASAHMAATHMTGAQMGMVQPSPVDLNPLLEVHTRTLPEGPPLPHVRRHEGSAVLHSVFDVSVPPVRLGDTGRVAYQLRDWHMYGCLDICKGRGCTVEIPPGGDDLGGPELACFNCRDCKRWYHFACLDHAKKGISGSTSLRLSCEGCRNARHNGQRQLAHKIAQTIDEVLPELVSQPAPQLCAEFKLLGYALAGGGVDNGVPSGDDGARQWKRKYAKTANKTDRTHLATVRDRSPTPPNETVHERQRRYTRFRARAKRARDKTRSEKNLDDLGMGGHGNLLSVKKRKQMATSEDPQQATGMAHAIMDHDTGEVPMGMGLALSPTEQALQQGRLVPVSPQTQQTMVAMEQAVLGAMDRQDGTMPLDEGTDVGAQMGAQHGAMPLADGGDVGAQMGDGKGDASAETNKEG